MSIARKIEEHKLAEEILEAVSADSNIGFCIECGEEAGNVEPDAREYICAACGEPGVYGAQELVFYLGG